MCQKHLFSIMKRFFILLLCACALLSSCNRKAALKENASAYTLEYTVTPNPADKYLYVNLKYTPTGKRDGEMSLKMPVWAPGYYLIVDYPKNLADFDVRDMEGNPVSWRKEGKNEWIVSESDKPLEISWRTYANERSVAESRIEDDLAFIATNGVFMYADNETDHPVTVTYSLPGNWEQKISTSLEKTGESTFFAPDFDVLFDSPALLGRQRQDSFELEGRTYYIAMETPDGYDECPFKEDIRKVIKAATDMMEGVPYKNYTFIYLGGGGGGLEHQSSQACYTSGSFRFSDRPAYLSFLSFATHEYFHNYNVKAIRPVELGPFDYDREVFTPSLWISEGFTVYYESKLLERAGIYTAQERLDDLSQYFRAIYTKEGHKHMSLRQSSYDIWLNFFNFLSDSQNVTISYYDKGPILGLLFDCRIQTLTDGKKSLDDLMRLLYKRFYVEKGRGFEEEEFWDAAAEVAGTPLDDLRRYVETTDEIDFETILTPCGISLDRSTWHLSLVDNQ